MSKKSAAAKRSPQLKKWDRVQFKAEASHPLSGLVVVFDLEGFSHFFSQPDVQTYVPDYLNLILGCLGTVIDGGDAFWHENYKDPLPRPAHVKYLGDGAMYVWTESSTSKWTMSQKRALMYRLWHLKYNFEKVVAKATELVPVTDIPTKIRFGVAQGTVYKLTRTDKRETEFAGYCINLASRLQSYCRELGFVASARLKISFDALKESNWNRCVATSLAGFPNEVVLVALSEWNDLDESIKAKLFDDLER